MLVQLHFQAVIALASQTLVLQHLIPSQSQHHSRIPRPPSCICLFNHCAMRIPKRPFSLSLSNFSPQLAPLLSSRLGFASGICAKPPRSFANATLPGSFFPLSFACFAFRIWFSCALSFLISLMILLLSCLFKQVTCSAKSAFVVELAIYL